MVPGALPQAFSFRAFGPRRALGELSPIRSSEVQNEPTPSGLPPSIFSRACVILIESWMRSSARMNGQLSEHPLAELIREIATAKNTGALRLERERVKVVVYFDAGEVVYATSNVRSHRLGEVLKKAGVLNDALVARFGGKGDQDLADALLSQGLM